MWHSKKEKNLIDNSSDSKIWIIEYAGKNQPFLVAIRGRFNTIGQRIGIVQNMIVDATLTDGIESSHDSLDAGLGELVTEISFGNVIDMLLTCCNVGQMS